MAFQMNSPGSSVENGFQEDRREFWATAKRLSVCSEKHKTRAVQVGMEKRW